MTTPSAGEDVEQREVSHSAERRVRPRWKTSWPSLPQPNPLLPFGPEISLLVIYLREVKMLRPQKKDFKYVHSCFIHDGKALTAQASNKRMNK